jgi:hypothetical protein
VLEFVNNLCGARNRVGMGLSYRPARLHRLAELIPLNQFLGSIKVYTFGLRRIQYFLAVGCDCVYEQEKSWGEGVESCEFPVEVQN